MVLPHTRAPMALQWASVNLGKLQNSLDAFLWGEGLVCHFELS